MTSERERDLYREKLRASGPSSEPWTTEAQQVFQQWRRLKRKKSAVAVECTATECYRQGCTMTIRYANDGGFDLDRDLLARTPAFRAWPGPKWRSGPVKNGNRVEATWILLPLNPPAPEPPRPSHPPTVPS